MSKKLPTKTEPVQETPATDNSRKKNNLCGVPIYCCSNSFCAKKLSMRHQLLR